MGSNGVSVSNAIPISKKTSGTKAQSTARWSDMMDESPGIIDPKLLKGLSFSFGTALTEEQFKEQQSKGKARVAKSLDLTDPNLKKQVLRE
jgi:hypothetical protein